ncbi:MAG: Ig-like domain-containing protein, partial [Saprospiraceae bacterium]
MNIITKLLLALVFYANIDENNLKQSLNKADDCIEDQGVQIIKYGLCYNSTIEPEMASNFYLLAPSLTASKVVVQVGTDTGPAGPSPGDQLQYTITITSNAGMDATGVQLTDFIDPNTTLVPGSLKIGVVAYDDAYSTVGNVSISVPAASGVLTNDLNLDGDVLQATAFDATGTQGTVTMNPNGSFTFNPNPGFEGTTTFGYTVSDGLFASTGTVTVTVTGMIWFINSSAASGGDGRINTPFNTMNAFNSSSLDEPGDNIFV